MVGETSSARGAMAALPVMSIPAAAQASDSDSA